LKKKSLLKFIIVILVLVFSFGLRIYAPHADLPENISFSGSVYTDEGNQCHNSRSKILFGDWYPDDWRITHYNPVIPYFKYMLFKIFGIGLLQVRMVSHFFALFSLIIFFFTLRTYFGFGFTVLGTFLFGINYLLIMFSKIGTFETPMIFWILLSLFFIEKFRHSHKSYLLFFSGASAYMAFIFKNTAAHFIPVPILAYILFIIFTEKKTNPGFKAGLKNLAYIVMGILMVLMLWVVLFYIPNREWIWNSPGQYIGNQMFPRSISAAVGNFFAFNWRDQFYKIPIVWVLAILYIPLFFRRLILKRSDLTEIGFSLLFFSHTFFFLFISNRPTRYLIAVIPALIFLTTLLFKMLASQESGKNLVISLRKRLILFVFDLIWIAFATFFCFIPLFSRYITKLRRPPLSWSYLFLLIAGILMVYGLFYIYKKLFMDNKNLKFIRFFLIFIFIGFSVFINIKQYHYWKSHRTYTVFNLSRELGKKLDKAYIAGLTAPVAVLENQHRSLFLYPNFVNWDKSTFGKYPLTHALLASFNQEITSFYHQWPQQMKQARLLKVYNVKEQFLHLYSFVDPRISHVEYLPDNRFKLLIQNPQKKSIKARIGKILFFGSNIDLNSLTHPVIIERDADMVTLQPGENMVIGKKIQFKTSEQRILLFFLDIYQWANKHRYEGEKFPRKVGEKKEDLSASARFVSQFQAKKQKPGFLTFGPFIPFTTGFMTIDFNLKFTNIKSKIRSISRVDVFSYRSKKILASEVIKPKQVNPGKFDSFRLAVFIPDIEYLEFRVFPEGYSNVDLDYVEVTYYQGYLFDTNQIRMENFSKGGQSGEPK